MTGLITDVFVLVIMAGGEILDVITRWTESAAEQALFAWVERNHDIRLPKDLEEARDIVNDYFGNLFPSYRYEIVECRISDI